MSDETMTQRNDCPLDAGPLSKAMVWARIDEVEGGVLSGTSSALAHVFVVVNGRAIGAVPVARATASSGLTDPRPGSWRFDARLLPPHLFLEDRLKVEIQAGRTSSIVLDTREIDTSRLFPFDNLPPGHGALEGYIDGYGDESFHGWVWDPTNPGRRIEVQLFVDGVFRGIFEASQLRPDLQATGRGDGCYGFAIPARGFRGKAGSKTPRVRIVSREPEVWDVPFAPHTRAPSRRWPAMSRWRRVPANTGAFVAILTGAERFPKKIYVIDQTTQKMPDAFAADYVLLALEFLRVEMAKSADDAAASWTARLASWWRQRAISGQIRRLSALAEATAATQRLLRAPSPAGLQQPPAALKRRHAQS